MLHSLTVLAILAIAATPINACDFHSKRSTQQFRNPHVRRDIEILKRAGEEKIDFAYVDSFDWHTIKEEYATCHSGTTQSPISVHSTQGLATTHTPDFSGYASFKNATGTFSNWGFGPSFTLDHQGEDFSTLPPLRFDSTEVYLSGWHIHYPSEHLVDGVRSRAEMHMVHVDAAGAPAAVVGVRIEPSHIQGLESHFYKQLPAQLVAPGASAEASEIKGVSFDHMLAIQEVGHVQEYWTYAGSLTTPPCSEGLRWFLPAQTLKVSEAQMVHMLGAGRFSSRVEQVVWNQAINV